MGTGLGQYPDVLLGERDFPGTGRKEIAKVLDKGYRV